MPWFFMLRQTGLGLAHGACLKARWEIQGEGCPSHMTWLPWFTQWGRQEKFNIEPSHLRNIILASQHSELTVHIPVVFKSLVYIWPLLTLNLPTILPSSVSSFPVFLPRYNSKVCNQSLKPLNSGWLSNSFGYTWNNSTTNKLKDTCV